jgi:hypothetical protein
MQVSERNLYQKVTREMRGKKCQYSREEALNGVTTGLHEDTSVCAKQDMILHLLKHGLSDHRSVAVFTHHIGLLDWVVRSVHKSFPGVGVGTVHGSLSSVKREEAIQDFNSGKIRVLVLTTRSSCYGINLRCQTIIIAEMDWNAAVDEQATARAHRGDSLCAVDIYFPLTRGTFEERKYNRQLQETTVNHKLLEGLTINTSPSSSHPSPSPSPSLSSLQLSLPEDVTVVSHDDTVQNLNLGTQIFDETCKTYLATYQQNQERYKTQNLRMYTWICTRIVAALTSGPKTTSYFLKHQQRNNFPKTIYRSCLHRVARLQKKNQWNLKSFILNKK